MKLAGKKIGFAVTGSHCTLETVMPEIKRLVDEGAQVVPIFSSVVMNTDTRFGKARDWVAQVEAITGRRPISTIVEAEPIGPRKLLDAIVVAPCTGNTLGKIANAITDGPVTMSVKAHLRNGRPVIIAVSTNDGLGMNAKNLGLLLNTKNIYFVPFGQDNPHEKPNSIEAKMDLILPTILAAFEGKQLQPLLIGSKEG